MLPVILSGGGGTRLWPLSRELYPKQFLPLAGDGSMLEETVRRLSHIPEIDPPVVVCNEAHRFLVAQQLQDKGIEHGPIILEPLARNTAPAVAAAAHHALGQGEDPVLLVLPADHVVRDPQGFAQAVGLASPAAEDDYLVTFGIVPEHAETGYGYIKMQSAGVGAEAAVRMVAEFVEKPSRKTAEEYVASGDYLWNSGMFMFKASRYLEELTRLQPEMAAACERAYCAGTMDMDFVRLDHQAFEECPDDSVDYAVMEHTDAAVVVPMGAGWSDVGSWGALHEVADKDTEDNVALGDVIAHDSEGCYLRAESRLVAAVGLSHHIVVETADAVLIAPRDRAQDVRCVVKQLKEEARDEHVSHRRVYRPWGSYECLAHADRFQVKHIVVNPGASLSLQMHHHRAEHWTIVKGTAKVTRDDDVFLLSEDQSTYIPVGTKHRLENVGVLPLELIEVQTGSYLGEDDIVRFDDVYGRAQ